MPIVLPLLAAAAALDGDAGAAASVPPPPLRRRLPHSGPSPLSSTARLQQESDSACRLACCSSPRAVLRSFRESCARHALRWPIAGGERTGAAQRVTFASCARDMCMYFTVCSGEMRRRFLSLCDCCVRDIRVHENTLYTPQRKAHNMECLLMHTQTHRSDCTCG